MRVSYCSAVAALVFLLFTACSSSNEPAGDKNNNGNSNADPTVLQINQAKCSLDGSAWTSANAVAEITPYGMVVNAGYSIGTFYETINMEIDGVVKVGSVGSYTQVVYNLVQFNPHSNSIYTAESPTVNITLLSDTEVQGTFSFTAVNSSDGKKKVITNGAFRCSLEKN